LEVLQQQQELIEDEAEQEQVSFSFHAHHGVADVYRRRRKPERLRRKPRGKPRKQRRPPKPKLLLRSPVLLLAMLPRSRLRFRTTPG
jgi:hypothetical protein